MKEEGSLGLMMDELPDEISSPLLGAISETYRLEERLGCGGGGVVYRAIDRFASKSVAIKVLRHGQHQGEEQERATARFAREIELSARLAHSRVVRLLDHGQASDGALFAVFEYVRGRNLAEYLREEGPLPATDALPLLAQIAEALVHAHERGVIHRDLKPSNIMLEPQKNSWEVKVLDFGVSTLAIDARMPDFERLTSSYEVLGTPGYAAPEQLRAERATERSDVYAWGLIAWECLSGAPAFSGATRAEIYHDQLSVQEITLPSSLARHPMGKLLRRALYKAPEKRLSSAKVLLKELERIELTDSDDAAVPAATRDSFPLPPTLINSTVLCSENNLQVVAVCCRVGQPHPQNHASLKTYESRIEDVLRWCLDTVVDFGGSLCGRSCDYAVFYFVETAVEQAAVAAASACLALQSLGVSVGLHTGMVAEDRVEVATGMTPAQALKLATAAEAGEVLVSPEVGQLLRREFCFEARADLDTRECLCLAGRRRLSAHSPSVGAIDSEENETSVA